MTRLRTGIVGAGLIVQVEHIPNVLGLADKFDLVGVADPSATARESLPSVLVPPPTRAPHRCCVPGSTPSSSRRQTSLTPRPLLAALAAGLHVFCEKPLCYSVADADAILKARDAAGRIVQVGYIKRFDPSYEGALDLLPEGGTGLPYISVEVNDPDSWPFVAHHPHRRREDVPMSLIEEGPESKSAKSKKP